MLKVLFLFTFFISLFIIFINNYEYVEVKKIDLLKYSWFKPFYEENKLVYEGGFHDIDTGYMELNFTNSNKNILIDVNNFKVIAKKNDWQVIKLSDNNLLIKKDIAKEIGIQSTHIIKIEIILNNSKNKVIFKIN